MTTDTKAVRRWDFIAIDQSTIEIAGNSEGEYILFTDHERVVGELENYQRLTDDVLADRHALIASLRDELETLNEAQAVCDGTIPIALLHWHQRALAAESALTASLAEVDGLRSLVIGILDNRHKCFIPCDDPKSGTFNWDERAKAAMEKGNV